MITFETLHIDTAELAWELFMSGDAATLDDAAGLAVDIINATVDYGHDWDMDAYEWQLAAAWAVQVQS